MFISFMLDCDNNFGGNGGGCKKIKLALRSVVLFMFLFFVFTSVYAQTPVFTFTFGLKELNVSDDVITQDTFTIKNFSDSKYIYLLMSATVNGKDAMDGWVFLQEEYVEVYPEQTRNLNFAVYVPENVCNGTYDVFITAKLAYYDDAPGHGAGVTFSTAIGKRVTVNVDSGITCDPSDPVPGLDFPISELKKVYIHSLISKDIYETIPLIIAYALNIYVSAIPRLVYYDYDGGGFYSAASVDKIINLGDVHIYDLDDDSLLQSTNLASTGGQYNIPSGSFSGTKDIYMTTDLGQYSSPGVLDTTWGGNFYVNRQGDSSNLKNSFVKYGITDYHDIYEQLDIRSRNLDRAGDFSLGTMSIGPDDLDQIISPLRWDMLVEGTNFKYVDLDHSGRIGPDDKDHIISPIYWDFPN